MKSNLLKTLRLILLALGILTSAQAETPWENAFSQANIAYQNGNYPEAIASYQKLASEKHTAALHFNLGNSYYKTGQFGHAILHYEKARVLQPGDPDIKANLRIAREAAEMPPADRLFLSQISVWLTINTWGWIATISGWCFLLALVLPRLFAWKGGIPLAILGLSVISGLLSMLAITGYHFQGQEGIVLNADSPLKVAPTEQSPASAYLQAGEMARIEKRHDEHFFVKTSTGQTGWLDKGDYAPIWQ